MAIISRRETLIGGLAGGGLLLTACGKITGIDALTQGASFHRVMAATQSWTMKSQRFLQSGGALAREFDARDISPKFKANGTLHPTGADYEQHLAADFRGLALYHRRLGFPPFKPFRE